MKKKFKICYITRDYSKETNFGGIATYIEYISQYLISQGHEVHVITEAVKKTRDYIDKKVFVHAIKPNYFWRENYFLNEILKLKVIDMVIGRMAHAFFFNFPAYMKFRKLNKDVQFDIVEAEDGGGIANLIGKLHNINLITKCHTSWTIGDILNKRHKKNYPDEILIKYLEDSQIRNSKYINADSYALRLKTSIIHKIPIKRIDVLYYGLDISEINAYSRRRQSIVREEYIIYFGRIEERKGIDVLAKAIKKVFKKNKKIKLVLVGDRPGYSRDLKTPLIKINRENSHRIIFLPKMNKEKLWPLVAQAEAVVLPSRWEAFGFTCLESMALGCIVIASAGSGFEEQIQEDGVNGFLFSPGNHVELSKKILFALKLPERKKKEIRKNAFIRAKDFDNSVTNKKALEYYSNVLRKESLKKK
jgi:glycosyltransferase involved in cell wall biosynthesis